jgi:hypothetical protein
VVFRSSLARLGVRTLVGVVAAIVGGVAYHAIAGGSVRLAVQTAFYIVGGVTLAVSIYSFTGGASLLEDHLGVATYYRAPRPGDSQTVAELAAVAILLIGAGMGIRFI